MENGWAGKLMDWKMDELKNGWIREK